MRKNIFTEKWMREFKELVRKEQASSSKRQASSLTSLKLSGSNRIIKENKK
jgi:hypothetical protein